MLGMLVAAAVAATTGSSVKDDVLARLDAIRARAAVIAEISGMAEVDSAMRNAMLDRTRNLANDERQAVYAAAGPVISAIDKDHADRLRAIMARDGWPTLSGTTRATSRAAALIANHNQELLPEAVALMEPLVANKEVLPEDFARLSDRLATIRNQPQIYGTQGTSCVGGRYVTPVDVVEPEKLDARRASVGLEPMTTYLANLNKTYGGC